MLLRLVLPLCALCALCGETFAASPSLGGIQPRGAQRGTEAVLTFSGGRLADAQEVLVYYPGIAVKKLEVVNDATLKATVTIAPDCPLGEHAFRVRTASGISEVRTFWIGALPVVEEVEPNNDFDKPQPVPLNVTVHGIVQAEDQDYFVVECKKGQRLSVEVEGMRLGVTFFDPYVAILDAKRFELATGDDSALSAQDGGCSVVVPADGKYIVQIRESAYGGNGACQYRLHIGNFPRPTAVVPAGGKPGEELEVTFLGDPSGPIKQKVKLPANPDDQWRLHCQTPEGIHPAGFKFRVANLPNALETPNNGAPATASPGAAPGAFNGVVSAPNETDYFKFAAKKGQVFDARCFARQLGSPLDPVLYFGNATGGVIAANDDSGGPDSYFRLTIPADGDYTLWVHDHLKKGGADYFYRIELTPVAAAISTTIPKVDGNNPANQDRQTITVPKGGRNAVLVIANRADFGGPLNIGLDKLPAGVTLTAEQMEAGLNVVPVVFDAKPDAPTAGHLAVITAVHPDPNVKASYKLSLDAALVLGPPNQTVYARHEINRTAVAVGEVAPYSIEVIEPKVPLVQNGSFNLRVVAKRAAGFKGAITVFPLWTPPGMGIQGSAVIPEGQTETVLPMNAAPDAGARKWKTAVHAVADAGKGPVWVSSQLFALEVAAPVVTLAMERPAVEQGGQTQLFCKVAVTRPFEGKAKVTVYGLPTKVTTQVLEVTKDTKEIAFPIVADKTSPIGQHNVFAQVVIDKGGELITGNTGGTQLRIDAPLPPKVAATPTPQPNPMTPKPPTPTPATPEKRLTRLEQLRKEAEEREKAAASGTQPPPKKEEPKKP
ncbi:PPC domain-containing protein [Gemmata sp. G18]|uniref:PPC domain-containing protein n=1 Tax=Gemmata palustris TaxID=2822762 RepID=A0ABS5C1A2_9BACT|nr:PPC domain-containing protein [Gemmata palustris]MBP3959752.1 PPC domain-containing protein [Gemmata palustris]